MKIARKKDKEVVRVVEEMKKAKVKVLQGNEWQIKGNLVLKEEKVYVPKDTRLRVEIIQLHHDMLVAEHRERQKTTKLVMKNYQWPEVIRNMCRGLSYMSVNEEQDGSISGKTKAK